VSPGDIMRIYRTPISKACSSHRSRKSTCKLAQPQSDQDRSNRMRNLAFRRALPSAGVEGFRFGRSVWRPVRRKPIARRKPSGFSKTAKTPRQRERTWASTSRALAPVLAGAPLGPRFRSQSVASGRPSTAGKSLFDNPRGRRSAREGLDLRPLWRPSPHGALIWLAHLAHAMVDDSSDSATPRSRRRAVSPPDDPRSKVSSSAADSHPASATATETEPAATASGAAAGPRKKEGSPAEAQRRRENTKDFGSGLLCDQFSASQRLCGRK
jgi:hypothetical protein